jgi:hypothetical protein
MHFEDQNAASLVVDAQQAMAQGSSTKKEGSDPHRERVREDRMSSRGVATDILSIRPV